MSNSLISTPQDIDPGSEGSSGYEYQRDVAILRCIEMIECREMKYVVCEFHEDIVQIDKNFELELVQVKKRETGNWTLESLLRPTKTKKCILASLFAPIENGKNVAKLLLCGFGRIASDSKHNGNNLPEFIALLNTPISIRDATWQRKMDEYEHYVGSHLESQGISQTTVGKALRRLCIDFSLPHPAVMESECKNRLAATLGKIWAVEMTIDDIEGAYQCIYQRIKRVSNKPKQQWLDKAVSREDILTLVKDVVRSKAPSKDRISGLTTQDKLSSVDLGSRATYAFQKRLDAIVLRYELSLSSNFWEDRKVDIDSKCKIATSQNSTLSGLALWQQLRRQFDELGTLWIKEFDDSRLDSQFAEGVFFDMTGVCEAQWMRKGR